MDKVSQWEVAWWNKSACSQEGLLQEGLDQAEDGAKFRGLESEVRGVTLPDIKL